MIRNGIFMKISVGKVHGIRREGVPFFHAAILGIAFDTSRIDRSSRAKNCFSSSKAAKPQAKDY